MRRRPLFIGAALLAVFVVLTGFTYLYDNQHSDQLGTGVTIGGIDVSGLHAKDATAKIVQVASEPLRQPLVVKAAGHTFTLDPVKANVAVDVPGSVQAALQESRKGNVVQRVTRFIADEKPEHPHVALRVAYSAAQLEALVKRVRRAANRPMLNARVNFRSGGVTVHAAQTGRAVQVDWLRQQLATMLSDPEVPRAVAAQVKLMPPRVTTQQVAKKYPTLIVVDRGRFTLTLYKHLHVAHVYKIAVGRQGLATPAGLYHIYDKQVNPSWHVPNSSWAGKLAGRTIPPGPQDPIKARWMGIAAGAGIHGTNEPGSIGSAASHGCIRMRIPDVIALYPQVPLHTPIYIR